MSRVNRFAVPGWALVFLLSCFSVAEVAGADCPDLRSKGVVRFQDFSSRFPGMLAWVGSPNETQGLFDVGRSINYYPLTRAGCHELDKSHVANLRGGVMQFVVDRTALLQGEDELEGGFLLALVDVRYRESGGARFSAYRFGKRWLRDGKEIGGLPPTLAYLTGERWNEAHAAASVTESDKLFRKPLHATSPAEGGSSTWDFRDQLKLVSYDRSRSVFVMIFLLTSNTTMRTIPFKMYLESGNDVSEIDIRLVSDIPSLNTQTVIRVRE